MRPGFDILGAAHPHFPLRKVLAEIPRDAPIGIFWNQFGDGAAVLKLAYSMGFRIFRIHCWWSYAHVIVPENILRTTLQEINHTIQGMDGLTLYISHSCEHTERNVDAVQKRVALVHQSIPSALAVNSVWSGALVDTALTEKHGSNPGKCDLASTDGDNIYDIDAAGWVKTYGNRKHPAFLWGRRFNLLEIPDPGQNVPTIPNRRAAPSVEDTRSIVRLAEERGHAPKPIFSTTPFEQPSIYKTHAEDDQEPDESLPDELRENRPVLIIKPNVSSVDILTYTGKVIGKLPKYGSFPGGLTRYYSGLPGGIGLYGYQIGNQAKRASGSEFVWFRAGRTNLGPVHPAFRCGVFR